MREAGRGEPWYNFEHRRGTRETSAGARVCGEEAEFQS